MTSWTARPRSRLVVPERGSVSVEAVILFPLVLLLVFVAVQAGLWFHARSVALGAAQEGARVMAGEFSGTAAGLDAAAGFVAAAGGGDVLVGTGVTGARTAGTASVTVTGRPLSLLPGWSPLIEQSATMPVERITG